MQVEDASASYTLTANGSALSPGISASSTGTLTVRSNLAFAQNGGTPAAVNIDVAGAGSPVVVSNDVLAVTRNVTGLSNAVLNVSLSGVTGDDVRGKTFTILTCANDLAGQSFAAVNYSGGLGRRGHVQQRGDLPATGAGGAGPAGHAAVVDAGRVSGRRRRTPCRPRRTSRSRTSASAR